jgi:hypothetical protein
MGDKEEKQEAFANKLLGFLTTTDQPISGKSGVEYLTKIKEMIYVMKRNGTVTMVMKRNSPAVPYLGHGIYTDLSEFSGKEEVDENQSNDFTRLVNQRPQAITHQQSISSHQRSTQGQQTFSSHAAANVAATPQAADNQEETRERAQQAQHAPTAAPARRTHDAGLQDGLFADMPRGTRRGTIYNVPNNQTIEEQEEEEVNNVHDPVTPTHAQPAAQAQATPGPVNATGNQAVQPGSGPQAPDIFDDKPELDIDVQSYNRRLKWLVNKRNLSKAQHERERQDLEAVLVMLQSSGLVPRPNTETVVMTPSSALTTSTKSSGRSYGMLAEGLNNRESFEVWKVQEARTELAMQTLEKWFSPYARAMAPDVWRSCDPALIFDFYFNLFIKDIPMVATILHEQLRMFTFTRGQKIAEFLTVFRILIDMIESLEQTPMSEFQKRVTLERAFLRTNYNHYRHVFHNAKMNGFSFNETIGYIEGFELEDMQMKEAQALMKKHEEPREPKKSGKTSNQPKVQASVNLAAEQPHRGNHDHRSGAPGGRGPGRGKTGGRSGNNGKGRGNSADRRYQGGQQQEPHSQVPSQTPPNPPRQYSGQQQQQPNRGHYQGQGLGQQASQTRRDFHQSMQRQVQANPPQAPHPPRTHSTHFAADYNAMSSSEDETHLAMEVDSIASSQSGYEMCGMAMESRSDSDEEEEQEHKRQRLGTPGRSQSEEEVVTLEPVSEEEKEQIIQAAQSSTNFDLGDMGENEVAAIGAVQNHPSIPRFPRVHSPPTPPPHQKRVSLCGSLSPIWICR